MIRDVWAKRSEYPSFLSEGGVGWGCELDKVFCEAIRQQEKATGEIYPIEELAIKTVTTALSNPILYLTDRLEFISKGWFSAEGAMGEPAIAWGVVALVGLFAFLIFSIRQATNGELVFFVLLAISFVLLLPQMVGHVEPRYFIPLKLMVVLLAWTWRIPGERGQMSKSSAVSQAKGRWQVKSS
jgi:hypothetical protein